MYIPHDLDDSFDSAPFDQDPSRSRAPWSSNHMALRKALLANEEWLGALIDAMARARTAYDPVVLAERLDDWSEQAAATSTSAAASRETTAPPKPPRSAPPKSPRRALAGIGTGLRYVCASHGEAHGSCCCGPQERVTRDLFETPCCCEVQLRPALSATATWEPRADQSRLPAASAVIGPPIVVASRTRARAWAAFEPSGDLCTGPPPYARHCAYLI